MDPKEFLKHVEETFDDYHVDDITFKFSKDTFLRKIEKFGDDREEIEAVLDGGDVYDVKRQLDILDRVLGYLRVEYHKEMRASNELENDDSPKSDYSFEEAHIVDIDTGEDISEE